MKQKSSLESLKQEVRIPSGEVLLEGELVIPVSAKGMVLFVHGSGSSRHSSRNQFVARTIHDAGIGTLLFDLLTKDEERVDLTTRHLRFDLNLLARRLIETTDWLAEQRGSEHVSVGYFGSSTGGGAALMAAAKLGSRVRAVVSRGGRPDLASPALPYVVSPTLLIVGGYDKVVIELNKQAYEELHCKKELKIVPGATHLFEEPGTLEEVARLAAAWFSKYLQSE